MTLVRVIPILRALLYRRGLFRSRIFGLLLLSFVAALGHAGEMDVTAEQAAGCRSDVKPPAARSKEAPDAVKVLPPDSGIYAGLYSIGTTRADYRQHPAKLGYTPPIVFTFHDWISDEDFAKPNPHLRTFQDPLEDKATTVLGMAAEAYASGSVLAVTWALQCCDWGSTLWWYGFGNTRITIARLLNGEFDEYVRTVARQVKAYGKPMMLSPFSEFNVQGAYQFGKNGTERINKATNICSLYGDPSLPDGPERVRDAFMKVIDLFRTEGVKNVTWFMYAASGYMDPQHNDYSAWLHPKFFYPGDDYIDWVGQSAYFVDPSWSYKIGDSSVVQRALQYGYTAWGEVTQKPLFLPEFGASSKPQSDRSAVLRDVMKNYLPTLPRVKAFALADFLIAEICCQLPRMGQYFAQELTAWRESVTQNPYYVKRLRLSGQVR